MHDDMLRPAVSICGTEREIAKRIGIKRFAGSKFAPDDEICAKLSNRHGSGRDSSAAIVAGEGRFYFKVHFASCGEVEQAAASVSRKGRMMGTRRRSRRFTLQHAAFVGLQRDAGGLLVARACSSPLFLNVWGESV